MNIDSAGIQADSLESQYGLPPNIYPCAVCSTYFGVDIFHVGYGYDAEKLSKKKRRRRKCTTFKKRRRKGGDSKRTTTDS